MNHDIEAYLDGALDPEAHAAFEAQLARDAALRDAVAAARRMRDDLSWLAVERGVRSGEQAYWEKQRARKRRNRIMLLALCLTLLFVAGMVWQQKTPPSVVPQDRQMPSALPPVSDSIRQEAPKAPETSGPPQRQAADIARRNRLFAENFKPCKDVSLEPSLRSGAEPSPSDRFLQYYWENRYRDALAQFDKMPAAAQANDNLLFIKAECLLATGEAGEAVPILELILKNDRSRFMDDIAWHLALAYLKSGKTDQAIALLQKITDSAASPWQAKAETLLRHIQ